MNVKIKKLVNKYGIDLSDLIVLTEGASGGYLWNPFIALEAGAQKVICKVKDSRFGCANDVKKSIEGIAQQWGCEDRIVVKENLDSQDYSCADIITNSGHLRPIGKEIIQLLKKTSVIPLMWETWEFHDDYLDFEACRHNNILVMGTNESVPPCDMSHYSSVIGVKLLLEAGLEIAGNKIILMGSTETLCGSIKKALEALGAEVAWFSSTASLGDYLYDDVGCYLKEHAAECDAILFAEHHYPYETIGGKENDINFSELKYLNPEIKIAISCGNIDKRGLEESGLFYFPKKIEPFGYMSYQSYHVGPLPVMDLFAAGLKVGEAMVRARLRGLNIRDSALYALEHSPAQDFEGDKSWL